jgi:hypothetical protein
LYENGTGNTIANFSFFSVTVENRLTLFDQLFVEKLKAAERCYEIERMKVPCGIENRKLVAEDSVSVF